MDNIIIYNTDDGQASVKLYANDGTVWMPQAQMAELFGKDRSVITKHIKNIFSEGEVSQEGNVHFLHIPNVSKGTAFYSLDVILAVGFRVHSPRGTQFRRWANSTLKEYLQKGFVLDDERLKHPDGRQSMISLSLQTVGNTHTRKWKSSPPQNTTRSMNGGNGRRR